MFAENKLRVLRSDQLFFTNEISAELTESFPMLGGGWTQWSALMLNQEVNWGLRDESFGWSVASLLEENLKNSYSEEVADEVRISLSAQDIKDSFAWHYGWNSSGVKGSVGNCSFALQNEPDRDGQSCEFSPGANNCKTSAIFKPLNVVDDLREKGLLVYLDGRNEKEPKVGVITGVFDREHFQVAEYSSMKAYNDNLALIDNKDYSGATFRVLYIPKQCTQLDPSILHKNIVKNVHNDAKGLVLELSLRGQTLFVPIFKARIEHLPIEMKNGKYSRAHQPVAIDEVKGFARGLLKEETRFVILTKTTLNTFPKGYLSGKISDKDEGSVDGFQQMTYTYLLELNSDREIIGGTWTIPTTISGLKYNHRWSNIIKPLAVYYVDDVSLPAVGEIYSLFNRLRD